MAEEQKGTLVLEPVRLEAAKPVAAFLAERVKNADPETLLRKIQTKRMVLGRNLKFHQARKLILEMERLGARAVFTPNPEPPIQAAKRPEKTVGPPPTAHRPGPGAPAPQKTAPSLPGAPRPPVQVARPSRVLPGLLTLLLALTLGVAGWLLFSPALISYFSGSESREAAALPQGGPTDRSAPPAEQDVPAPQKTVRASARADFDFNGFHPLGQTAPFIMDCAPEQMREAYLYQFRDRPDLRFIEAARFIVEHQVFYPAENQERFSLGEIVSNGRTVKIHLLKNGKPFQEITLDLPMDYASGSKALDRLVAAMDPKRTWRPPFAYSEKMEKADQLILQLDPRDILAGLALLEQAWAEGPPDARVLKLAAKGMALLGYVSSSLPPDYEDRLRARTLGFLALARYLDPKAKTGVEDALNAWSMGYSTQAMSTIEIMAESHKDSMAKLFLAYWNQDLNTMMALQDKAPEILGKYLLARTKKSLDFYVEGRELSHDLAKNNPDNSALALEQIGDIRDSRFLTQAYLVFLVRLAAEKRGLLEQPKDWSWQNFQKELVSSTAIIHTPFGFLIGMKNTAPQPISLSRFGALVDQGPSLTGLSGPGFIMDEEKAREAMKALYSMAVFSRFHFLMHNLCSVEAAGDFVRIFLPEDRNHPQIMDMAAKVHGAKGERGEAWAKNTALTIQPDVPDYMVVEAVGRLKLMAGAKELLGRIPLVSQNLDGRPVCQSNLGWLARSLHDNDRAEPFYRRASDLDAYGWENWFKLISILCSDQPIADALKKFPENYQLKIAVANHYSKQDRRQYLEKALKYFEEAKKIAPFKVDELDGHPYLLYRLHRNQEAARLLEKWLKKNGRDDLETIRKKSTLAMVYLAMNRPREALETIEDDIKSYKASAMIQGAQAYKALGRMQEAEEVLLRAVDRYPDSPGIRCDAATFFWEQEKNRSAAILIAAGRQSQSRYSRWYFESFMNVFAEAPEGEILDAVAALSAFGAGPWEISALGFEFKRDRPEITFAILEDSLKRTQGKVKPMERLEKICSLAKVIRIMKGRPAAMAFLRQNVPPKMKGPFSMVLIKERWYDAILSEYPDPEVFKPFEREAIWLMRLMSWLAVEKKPQNLEGEMMDHYRNPTPDSYHRLGRYLLGLEPREQILKSIQTPKQRCEFSYYIGFGERMKGNLPEAALWYEICRASLLENNGEYHWASQELYWWAKMGLNHRHRLMEYDIRTFREQEGWELTEARAGG